MYADTLNLPVYSPLVSVVIPTYNRADFLFDTINTILLQDYDNLELLVCDNASTDHTEQVVRSYAKKHSNIHYVKNDENVGIINNFNRCVEFAKGEYIFRFADDDLVSPKYISLLVDELQRNPDAMVAIGAVSLMTIDGVKIHTFDRFESMHIHSTQGMPLAERVVHYLRYGHYEGWAWAVVYGIYRAADLKALQMSSKLRDPGALFVLSVFLRGEIVCCTEGAICYKRQGGASNVLNTPAPKEIISVFVETNKSSWMSVRLILDSIMPLADRIRIFPWIVLFILKQFIASMFLSLWVCLKIAFPHLLGRRFRRNIRQIYSGWLEKR